MDDFEILFDGTDRGAWGRYTAESLRRKPGEVVPALRTMRDLTMSERREIAQDARLFGVAHAIQTYRITELTALTLVRWGQA